MLDLQILLLELAAPAALDLHSLVVEQKVSTQAAVGQCPAVAPAVVLEVQMMKKVLLDTQLAVELKVLMEVTSD